MQDMGGQKTVTFSLAHGRGNILLVTKVKLLKRQEKNLTFDKCDFSYLQIDFSYQKQKRHGPPKRRNKLIIISV